MSINKTFETMANFVADNSDDAFFETIPFLLDNADFSCDDVRKYNLEIAFKKMIYNFEEDFIEQEKEILRSITPLDFNLAKRSCLCRRECAYRFSVRLLLKKAL